MSKSVKQRAIELVMYYDRSQGRKPLDVSKKSCGYDVRSNNKSDDRFIAVRIKKKQRHIYKILY